MKKIFFTSILFVFCTLNINAQKKCLKNKKRHANGFSGTQLIIKNRCNRTVKVIIFGLHRPTEVKNIQKGIPFVGKPFLGDQKFRELSEKAKEKEPVPTGITYLAAN